MDEVDLERYLKKFLETLDWCCTYFTKQSESYAAQHLDKTVFYSPVVNRIVEAQRDIKMMIAKLELEQKNG